MKGPRTTILLVLLGMLGAYYGWTQLAPGGVGVGAAGAQNRALASRGAGRGVELLATADLEQKPGTYRPGRDLFHYEEAAQRRQPRRRPQRPQQPAPTQPTPTPPRPVEPPAPSPPAIDVVYLGSFGYPGRRIAVFSDDEGVYNAHVGDVIKEKFLLVNIGYESVDLSFVGFPDASPERLAVGSLR